jgi:hypothetical protein
MRDHRAAIPGARVLVVHPAVLPHPLHLVVLLLRDQVWIVQVLVVLLLRDHLHLLRDHLHLLRDQRALIANVAVKIYQLVAVHLIALAQLVKYRKDVKPVILAGFVLSL